jgi:chlorophyll synthase
MRKLLLKLGDYLFVMRPLILVPAWSFYLLGSAAGKRTAGVTPAWLDWTPGAPAPFYLGFACLTAILVSAYLLNQIFDQESDRLNDKGHFLTRGIFTPRTVLVMAVASFLVASFLYRYVAPAQREVLVLAVMLSLAYSAPPLRLVARPYVDLLANAVGYGGIAYVAGFAAWSPRLDHAAVLSIPYLFLVGAAFLHTTLLDAAGDRQSDKRTTTVAIGDDRSVSLSCVLVMAGMGPAVAISFLRFGDWMAPVLLGLCAVIVVLAALRSGRPGTTVPSSRVVQLVTVVVTVPAAAAWPVYLVLLVPVILAARFYYTARFGITYPGPGRPAKNASAGASGPPLN